MLWTHPMRIYRCSISQRHDLSLATSEADIYGVDVWGRLIPDDEAIVMPNEFGIIAGAGQVYLPLNVDVGPGYLLWIYEPMVLNGSRVKISTTLSDAVEIDDVDLPVEDSSGFRPGLLVLVTDDVNYHRGKVLEAADDVVTLYSDYAVETAFDEGAVVAAGRYYQVMGHKGVPGYGYVQRVAVTEVPFRAVD